MRKNGYTNPAVLNLVKHSHDVYSGGNGPAGNNKGNEIPLGSRIIAVADAYDALTSWRSYRELWECRAAIGELNREVEKGKFDPLVVARLAELIA